VEVSVVVMGGKEARNGSTTRRTILKTAVGAGAVAGAGVGGVLLTTRDEPVLAQSGITASDVTIENGDGSVSELTINPEPTVEWKNLEESANQVDVKYFAGLSSSSSEEFVARKSDPNVNGTSGTTTVSQFSSPVDFLEYTSLTSSDFEDTTEDGAAETTDVDLTSQAIVLNDSLETIIQTKDTVTVTVSVNNLESSVSVSGPMNTDGK